MQCKSFTDMTTHNSEKSSYPAYIFCCLTCKYNMAFCRFHLIGHKLCFIGYEISYHLIFTSYSPKLTSYLFRIYKKNVFPYNKHCQEHCERGKRRRGDTNPMKIRIELDDSLTEEEVIIRCNSISEKVQKMQMALSEIENAQEKMVLYKKETEYYVKLDDILFFETGINGIEAHTKNDIFQTKRKLYELEELLPGIFMRISKSAILNTNKVYAINRNLTASSLIEFKDTYKQVYVSRNYYKPLKNKLEEKRNTNQTG